MKNKIIWLLILVGIYFVIKYYIPYWWYVIYPVNLLVTFMHEFGHALGAIITGWWVNSIEINSDWSWLAVTSWWFRWVVLLWGYVWSAILWNLLLYLSVRKKKYSEFVIYFLAWLMIFTSVFWFDSIISSFILLLLSSVLILLAKKTNFDSIILQFIWVTSILYIIEDYNSWPTSDISKFSDIFVIIPEVIWMVIWLIIVLIITAVNLKFIFKK